MYELSNRNGLPRDVHCFSGSLLGRTISTLPDSVCAFTRKTIPATSVASTISYNNHTHKLYEFTGLTYREIHQLSLSLSLWLLKWTQVIKTGINYWTRKLTAGWKISFLSHPSRFRRGTSIQGRWAVHWMFIFFFSPFLTSYHLPAILFSRADFHMHPFCFVLELWTPKTT